MVVTPDVMSSGEMVKIRLGNVGMMARMLRSATHTMPLIILFYQSSRRRVYDHHICHRKRAFGTQHDGIVDRLQRPLWTNKK